MKKKGEERKGKEEEEGKGKEEEDERTVGEGGRGGSGSLGGRRKKIKRKNRRWQMRKE